MANARAIIDVDINTSGAAAALRQLQSEINAFNSTLTKSSAVQATAMRNAKDNLLELVNASRFFTAETVKMQTAAGALDKTLSKGQVTLGQFFSAKFRKDGFAAAEVMSLANARASALQTQFVATGAAANGFREAIAIRPLQAFNDTTVVSAQKLAIQRAMLNQATTSMINFGKNTQWAGRQLMVGFTVPLSIFGGLAGKTFMELEKEAVNFKKVYGDAFTPPEELDANLKAVQELGKEYTKYGIAVKDTVGLAAQAAAAGAKNQDLIDATTQSTRLATLGQMDQNEALETTISLQSAFRLSGDNLAKSINFLNMVENQTVVTLQDLSAAIPRVAPVIQGLGGTVEDLAAMLAAMQEGGVSAEQGANALKSGLASLINPTDRAVEKLQGMGIALNTIIDANRGDLMGTIQAFSRALAGLDEFTRQQALETVFGKFQYARLGALFDNITRAGSQASRVLEVAGMSATDMAASAERELSAIEESVGTKLTASMERLKLAIAPIGELFVKMATPIINFLAGIAEGFNNLPDGAKKFLGIATVLTGLVIPAGTMFLGLLMNLLGTLVKFGNIVGLAFKGFLSGGIKGAFDNVSQALRYMSLSEIDAANSAEQLAGTTEAVNIAFRNQVGASEVAQAAVNELTYAYSVLRTQMLEAAEAQAMVFGVGAAAMGAAGGRGPGSQGPRRRGFNKGGNVVPGRGSRDTVPAILTPGEFVVNKKATKENFALLEAINGGKVISRFDGSKDLERSVEEANPALAMVGRRSLVPGVETGARTTLGAERSGYSSITDMPDELVRRINRETSKLLGIEGSAFIQDFGFGVATIPQSLNNQLRRGQASTTAVIAQFMRNEPLKEIFDYIGGSSSVRRNVEQEVVSQLDQMLKSGKTSLSDADFESVVTEAFNRKGKAELKRITDLGYGTSRATFLTGSPEMLAARRLNAEGERGYHGFVKQLATSIGMDFEKTTQGGRSTYLLKDPNTNLTYAISPGRTPRTGADYQVLPTRGKGSALAHFLRPRMRFGKGGMPKGGRGGVPAMLTPGEYIVSKDAAKNNLPLLQAINSGKIAKYARGGRVELISSGRGGSFEYAVIDPEGNTVGFFPNKDDAETARAQSESDYRQRVNARRRRIERTNRTERTASALRGMGGMKGMGISMGAGMAGGAMMMGAGMVQQSNPGLATAMNFGGMALSMGSMLPMLAPMLAPLAGIAVPALAVTAALGVTAAALYAWRKSVDGTAKELAEFGSNIGGTANALDKMGAILGKQTPAEQRTQAALRMTDEDKAFVSNEFAQILASEEGSNFINELKNATSEERFRKLTDYLRSGIAAGLLDQSQAQSFAKAVGAQLGDVALGTAAATAVRTQTTGPDAMLNIARQRVSAVEVSPAVQAVASATEGIEVSYQQASIAVGAAAQVTQDYANVIAVAEQQWKDGELTYSKYIDIINEAKEAQATYNGIIRTAITQSSDRGAVEQAVEQSLIASGNVTEEQIGAFRDAVSVGISTLGGGLKVAETALGNDVDVSTEFERQYMQAEAERQGTDLQTMYETNRQGFEALQEEALKAKDATMQLTEEGLQEYLLQAVRNNEISMDEATKLGQYLVNNPLSDAAQAYLNEDATVSEMASLINSANAEITGFTRQQLTQYRSLATELDKAGVSLVDFESHILSIPEAARQAEMDRIQGLGAGRGAEEQGRMRAEYIAGSQRLQGILGQPMATSLTGTAAYQQALEKEGGAAKVEDAFQAAQEAGVAERVIRYVINTEGANDPEDMIDKMEGLTEAQQDIMSLPEEMVKGLEIDVTSPQDLEEFGPAVAQLKEQWEVLQSLNPNIDLTAAMKYLTLDAKGNPLTAQQVADNTAKLNKAWKNLESGDAEVRKQAQIDIATAYAGNEQIAGKNPAEVAQIAIDELRKTFKDFDKLDPITQEQLIQTEMAYQVLGLPLVEENVRLQKAIADELAKPEPDYESIRRMRQQVDANNAKMGAAREKSKAQQTAQRSAGGKRTGSGSGGGGGEKPIGKQLQEEAGMLESFAKNFGGPNAKRIIAGPFAPEFLQYLQSQGEKGLNILKGSFDKFNQAYQDFKRARKAEEKIALSFLPAENIELQKQINLRQRLNSHVDEYAEKNGISQDMAQSAFDALSDTEKKIYDRAQRGLKVDQQVLANIKEKLRLNKENAQVDLAREQQNYVRGLQEETDLMNRLNSMGFRESEIAIISQYPNIYQMTNEEIAKIAPNLLATRDATEVMNEGIQDSVNVLNLMSDVLSQAADNFDRVKIKPLRDSIDAINDSIETLDRSKEFHQDLIETYEKQKDSQSEIIDGYEKEKDKIEEVFDERISSLEKIESINQRIAQQQQGQLDIASALSRGDVAAAAQATLAYQRDQAAQRIEDAKQTLEAQREAELAVFDDKIKISNEEILRLDQLIKGERDKIAGIDDQIETKRKSIRDINDQIKIQEEEKEKILERQRKVQAAINYLQIQQQINSLRGPGAEEQKALLQQQQTLISQSVGGPAALAEFGISATPTPGLDIAKMAADLQMAISPAQQLNALLGSLALNPQVAQAFKLITDNMVNGVLPNIDAVMAKAAELEIDPAVADEAYRIATEFVTVANTADDSNKNMVAMLTDAQQVNGVIGGINAIIAALNQQAAAAANANRVRRQELEEAAAVGAAGFYSGTPAASTTQGGKTPPKKTEPAKGKGKGGKGKGKNKAFGGIISRAFGGMINYKGSTESAPGMMYGGKMKKYAYGSFVPGIGMTDRVPAMLTPGEFVVRKSVAAEYGPLLSALNSNVFPKMNNIGAMPKSSTNVKDGIQYNYDIDVNVAGTNASPDEIAQAVMYRIKRIDDRQVRGTKIG